MDKGSWGLDLDVLLNTWSIERFLYMVFVRSRRLGRTANKAAQGPGAAPFVKDTQAPSARQAQKVDNVRVAREFAKLGSSVQKLTMHGSFESATAVAKMNDPQFKGGKYCRGKK